MKAWQKFLLKLDFKTRLVLEKVIYSLMIRNFSLLDIKSISGKKGYFRCRVGKIRIVYIETEKGIIIDDIGYRGDIYKGL